MIQLVLVHGLLVTSMSKSLWKCLNGGGHLTNAATQQTCSIEEAEAKLIKAIDEYLEGGKKE